MDADRRWHWIAATLIVGAACIRLAYLAWICPFDLAPDEAHYWDWSRNLDWCYYSKGPLVAWLIRASCAVFGETMFAVRVPAVVCGSLLLAGTYTLAMQVHQSARLALALLVLAMTLPIVAAGSSLMTIDAPFTSCWMWALVFAYHAVIRSASWAWPVAGICVLGGVLAKHSMVLFVPSLGLFLAATPGFRGQLLRWGFWSMTGIGALGGLPILVWNALNGWVTLRHTQGHAGLDDSGGLQWIGPLKFLGGQFAVLLGLWFVVWLAAMWANRPTVENRPERRFLWWMSAPTFVFFGLFAFINGGGEPNWPIAAYLSGGVLAAGWLSGWLVEQSETRRRWALAGMVVCAGFGLVGTLAIHQPVLIQPVLLRIVGPATPERPAPLRRIDPTARLRGWAHLGEEVDRVRAELAEREIDPIIATGRWTQAGEVGIYAKGHPKVYCFGLLLGDRTSQYDVWRPNPVFDPDAFRGRTFLLVGADAERLRSAFGKVEPTRTIHYRENGHLVADWTITIAHDFRGMPVPGAKVY
jgi:4-amino-4-deoxy-L-arabinose transferase-like glycosyltransferase